MKTNGRTCDHCQSDCVDDCSVCGAPQCCPVCCEEAMAEILQKPVRRVQVATDRIYHVADELIEMHKRREAVFVCNGVSLEPCVVGRGGDGFHVKFNWGEE